eukprot:GCRY01005152.1.p1 GENE.GCRY01005152.1~~GCRY01005152.1.p1  ORF type:complete len:399 (+),score=33.13 GCRY01005152.1:95-1291(+)
MEQEVEREESISPLLLNFVNGIKRRRRTVTSLTTVLAIQHIPSGKQFRAAVNDWAKTCLQMENAQFQRNFRVNRTVFENLVEDCECFGHVFGRKRIPTEHRVLMTLSYLSNPRHYFRLSQEWGVSDGFACQVVEEVCGKIVENNQDAIQFPTVDERKEASLYFKSKTAQRNDENGIEGAFGALDGSHIRIKKPMLPLYHHEDYVNRKKYHSIQLQALVDHQKRFRDVDIGWQGCVHDARVYSHSELSSTLERLANETRLGEAFILADAAYPATKMILTPKKQIGPFTEQERRFNFLHSSARMVVEQAFGMLKNKWRILLNTENTVNADIPKAVLNACCILHNLIIDDRLGEESDEDEEVERDIEQMDLIENEEPEDATLRHFIMNQMFNDCVNNQMHH